MVFAWVTQQINSLGLILVVLESQVCRGRIYIQENSPFGVQLSLTKAQSPVATTVQTQNGTVPPVFPGTSSKHPYLPLHSTPANTQLTSVCTSASCWVSLKGDPIDGAFRVGCLSQSALAIHPRICHLGLLLAEWLSDACEPHFLIHSAWTCDQHDLYK
jgi:hypothetical protein